MLVAGGMEVDFRAASGCSVKVHLRRPLGAGVRGAEAPSPRSSLLSDATRVPSRCCECHGVEVAAAAKRATGKREVPESLRDSLAKWAPAGGAGILAWHAYRRAAVVAGNTQQDPEDRGVEVHVVVGVHMVEGETGRAETHQTGRGFLSPAGVVLRAGRRSAGRREEDGRRTPLRRRRGPGSASGGSTGAPSAITRCRPTARFGRRWARATASPAAGAPTIRLAVVRIPSRCPISMASLTGSASPKSSPVTMRRFMSWRMPRGHRSAHPWRVSGAFLPDALAVPGQGVLEPVLEAVVRGPAQGVRDRPDVGGRRAHVTQTRATRSRGGLRSR